MESGCLQSFSIPFLWNSDLPMTVNRLKNGNPVNHYWSLKYFPKTK